MPSDGTIELRVGASSDPGRVRETNEDAFLVRHSVLAVADGMGGVSAGEVASALALDVLGRLAESGEPSDLGEWVRDANRAVFQRASTDPETSGMGTTLVVVAPEEDHLRLAHVGDSRAYLLRAGVLRQLTEDHTKVQHMLKTGMISQEEAEGHPQRNVVTRAVGVRESVDADERVIRVKEGDRLLLCTDGLSGMVSADQILRILAQEKDPDHAAARLVDAANDAGGGDNVTALVIDVTGVTPSGRGGIRRSGILLFSAIMLALVAVTAAVLIVSSDSDQRARPSSAMTMTSTPSPTPTPSATATPPDIEPGELLERYAFAVLDPLPRNWQVDDPFPHLGSEGVTAQNALNRCREWRKVLDDQEPPVLPDADLTEVHKELVSVADLCIEIGTALGAPQPEKLDELKRTFERAYGLLSALSGQYEVQLPTPSTQRGEPPSDTATQPGEGEEPGTGVPPESSG